MDLFTLIKPDPKVLEDDLRFQFVRRFFWVYPLESDSWIGYLVWKMLPDMES